MEIVRQVMCKVLHIEKILEKLGFPKFGILKLTRKMLVHTALCSQFSKQMKPKEQSYSEASP